MKTIIILMFFAMGSIAFAHNGHYNNIQLKHWSLSNGIASVDASFLMEKDGEVYLELANDNIVHYPFSLFTSEDQEYILHKIEHIQSINGQRLQEHTPPAEYTPFKDYTFWIAVLLLTVLGFYIHSIKDKRKLRFAIPLLGLGIIFTFFGFTSKVTKVVQTVTNPLSIDSAFVPFKPKVNTRWDANYFYVESKGIPDHEMMTGITGWQQQVPIPQCYIGNNAWSIPLNPEIAATPVPVNPQHFLRGAIAVAVNGVAIFNPYTNTGVDAKVDGQLDIYGGHCGRADDYHYHIAPMVLYNQTAATLPVAYALDGFAVYGNLEPDGAAMKELDANHGHYGTNGVYHYHGTTAFPYMVGNMVGKVTEDNTMQIIPQASAKPVRDAGTPLKGAVITGCKPNGNGNGYTLTYTLNGQNYSVDYNWTSGGKYTFNFISPSGTNTQTYNGFTQCEVPTEVNEVIKANNDVTIYPNPAKSTLHFSLQNDAIEKDIQSIAIYSINGALVSKVAHFKQDIDVKNLAQGVYIVKIQFGKHEVTKKLVVE